MNFRELQRMLFDAGFTECSRRKRHIKYKHPSGLMVVASASLKNHRGRLNFEADVKRAIRMVNGKQGV